MIEELQGAFVMLDGVAKNSTLHSAAPCPLTSRVDSLEAKVEELKVLGEIPAGPPKFMFSVDTQTQLGSLLVTTSGEATCAPQMSVDRHLQMELEVAATEDWTRRAASISTGNSPPATSRSVVTRNQSPIVFSRQSPPVAHPFKTDGSLSIAALRNQRAQKEAAANKIQSVLKEIQTKFQELTAREPLHRPLGGASQAETRKVSELIAKQKEAIFEKERQLVQQRNKLWREIADLEAMEENLLRESQGL
jgi:hypothetical protein